MSQRIAAIATLVCGLSAHGATFDAPYSPTAPTIDGSLSAGEWVGASSNRITMVHNNPAVTHLSTVYFKHDNTWLYIGVNTEFSNTSDMYWACEFDGNNSHARDGNATEPHVDISISAAGPSRPSYYNRYDAHLTTGAISVTPPTGTAKASAGSNPVTFEFKIKISELGATPGSLIGFYFQHGYDGSTSYGYTYVDVPIAQWSHIRLLNSSLSQGLVAYYPFNGNPNDASENGNSGALAGSIVPLLTTDRFGNPNSAYYFAGSGSRIEVPDSTSLRPQELTAAAWVNPADTQWPPMVLSKRYTVSTDPYNSFILDATWPTQPLLWNFCRTLNGSQVCQTGPAVITNQWSLLVGTDDLLRKKLYVNGQLVADEPSGGFLLY